MAKIWAWLKTHWKWLIAPLWAVSILVVWLFTRGGTLKLPVSGTTDQAANNAVDGVIQAAEHKTEAITKLETQYQAKIEKMSVEQRAEWEKVKDQPIQEVASWIDHF
jgi:membrane protein insertase Oxa1/YidC/SpoIIIJ